MLLTGNDSIEVGLGTFDFLHLPTGQGKTGIRNLLDTIDRHDRRTYFKTPGIERAWLENGIWVEPTMEDRGPHEWGFDQSYAIHSGGSNHWNRGVFPRQYA